ncbi:hypothetical protein [Faecalimicrobium dakarense]|uniref:hypothetical protein n=1 Tax=Faecalimicrobium dakarense TaxID=1301100 RepID=UPI0005A99BB9|nr:hypothetical protein [[Clostridium] dakarense]
MEGVWGMIIATILSRLIFSFLFYILNYKTCGVFESMQRDLGKLSNINRRILNFAGHALAISITVLLGIRLGISRVVAGLILGFLSALIDICFGDSIIGNVTNKNE